MGTKLEPSVYAASSPFTKLNNLRDRGGPFNCGAALTQPLSAAGAHPSLVTDKREVTSASSDFCCHPGHPADVQGAEGKAVEQKKSLPKKLQRFIGKVWREHDAGTLSNGSKLKMLHQLGTRGITTEEEQTAHHYLNELAVDIDRAIARMSDPWDEQLKQMGADCFLFAPEGPTPKQKARLLKMLHQVREGLNQPTIRIKLSDHLSSNLAGYVNAEPVRKKPGGKFMLHPLTGLKVSKGYPHYARDYFSFSPGMKSTVVHELLPVCSGAIDTGDQGKGDEPATRSYCDWARTEEMGRFHYSEGRIPKPHLAPFNADALSYSIIKAAQKPQQPEPIRPKPAVPAKPTATKPITITPATTKHVPPKIAQAADT
jgi:hypothetical protein